jgi:DNA-directed RNA polymerase II subunit RPB1
MEYRFKKSNAEVKTIKGIQFGVISPEFIKNISVTQSMEFAGREIGKGINHDLCYDPATGQPNLGAINDPRMGNSSDPEHPGYFGHIELVRPVYHVSFLKTVVDILRCVSYYTSELLVSREDYAEKKGRRNLKEITRLSKSIKKCPITQKKLPTYTKEGTKIAVDFGKGKEIINPLEVYAILEKITDDDAHILGLNTKYTRPEWMLLMTIPVPPPHVRPSVFMSSSQKCDDDLTTKLNEIVKTNIALANAIEKYNQDQGATNDHFISQLESLLQYNVSTFIDNQHPGQPPSLQRSGKPLKTLRERLAGKDGRVRGNLMGKRVDFSARTVITADPNLSLDQVGVPKTIALNLTIPETVTDYNKDHLLELVKRGPDVHPGAKFVIKNGGTKLDLKFAKITELKNGWVVERHLTDSDLVIFNRQPSLHKMSMMGHKTKVLDGSTFRLNLAYTGAYNADFDGDEMNLHVPQSLTARAEVDNLMMVDRMIVSPQSNKPVIGIIQDSLLSSCKMTRRNIFINKDRMMNMIMLIDSWDHNIPKPAIIRNGIEYWTGKQVFSLILPKSLIIENVKDPMNPSDKGIMIKAGKIISGSVDKSVIGKSQGGLIHILFNDFGSGTTKVFLNQVQKLSNYWIKQSGFTIGVGDAIASAETDKKVIDILEATKAKIREVIENGGVDGIKDPRIVEEIINTELNAAVSEAGKKAEENLNFNNNFKATVSAGSKGSNINISQIMAVVGQQNVEGRRINYGFKHRTLPHYQKFDVGQESRGFVENNYLKGLTPQEFFFHAMAGREGLIDTACKTAEVGYVQRRLVKALEDVSVKYDNTVRNSRGLIIQFLYGEDGIDATYMENIHLKLLGYNAQELEKMYYNNSLPEEFDLIKQAQLDLVEIARRKELNNVKLDDDYYPMPVNVGRILKFAKSVKTESQDKFTDLETFQEVSGLCNRIANIFLPCKEPIEGSEKYRSSNGTRLFRIYVISELATMKIKDLNKQQLLYILQDIELKFKKAIVNAGEMCGILAAQSIGELTTQLTLNSFHYAGVSAKNVTLGVPRLKELINVTKKLKTPSLTMYEKDLIKDLSHIGQKRIVEGIRSSLEYKTLQDIIKSSDIVFFDDEEYSNDFDIVELYKDLYEYTDNPLPEKFLSLRLQFESKKLEYVDTSLFEISKLLEKSIGNNHKIICSDDNTEVDGKENLFIRIICSDADDDNEKEQMATLRKIEVFCMSIKIKGYEGIERVYTREAKISKWTPEKGHYKEHQWILETEGTNLVDSMEVDSIDQTRTISNNVIEIYEVFGIEAARQALLNELRTVLSFDGSYVNYRHLAILVDTMTCRGSLTAMTRHGINRVADAGTLTKCSFEETVEVLTDAAAFGEIDTLKGISDNIMLGQTIPAGTGVMDIIYDTEMEPDIRVPSISREPTPGVILEIYIPSEPMYDPMSAWPF